MNYSLIDLTKLLVATALTLPVILLPGYAIADGTDLLHFRAQSGWRRGSIALLAAFAVLPALMSTLARFFGIDSALALTVLLALIGLFSAGRAGPVRPQLGVFAACLCWFGVVAFETIDFDDGTRLYQSYTVIDMVKHAATSRAIADGGAPPADAFFARPTPSGYYYFFYTLSALIERLGGRFVDARAAVGALIVLVAPAVHGLLALLLEQAGLVADAGARAVRLTILLLLLASGLDVIPMLAQGLLTGSWYPQLDMWNEAVVSWTDSLLWVPHHVTAVLAAWVGFLTLAHTIAERERGGALAPFRLLVAPLAFVSSLGLSVWTTLVAVLGGLLWFGLLGRERRWRALAVLTWAGAIALLIGLPHIVDMMHRSDQGAPLGLTIRGFDLWDVRVGDSRWKYLGRALLLPLNYGAELGVLLLGGLLFWRHHRRAEVHRSEVARLLTLYALCGLFFSTFTRSTVLMNDIAWRAPIALQLVLVVWTAAELHRLRTAARAPARTSTRVSLATLTGLGWATTLYGLLSLRAYVLVPVVPWATYVNQHPETDRALREAYEWMNDHLPRELVTQHNPAPPRVFDFGLYGRHPVGVADRQASLYGAAKQAVSERVDLLEPIFARTLAATEVRARAQRGQIDQLVVTREDAPWHDPSSWVWRTDPTFENGLVRIFDVARLGSPGRLHANCVGSGSTGSNCGP